MGVPPLTIELASASFNCSSNILFYHIKLKNTFFCYRKFFFFFYLVTWHFLKRNLFNFFAFTLMYSLIPKKISFYTKFFRYLLCLLKFHSSFLRWEWRKKTVLSRKFIFFLILKFSIQKLFKFGSVNRVEVSSCIVIFSILVSVIVYTSVLLDFMELRS